MASEIKVNVSLSVSKGNVSVNRSKNNVVTMSGAVYAAGVQSIPTTAAGTAIGIGSVGTAGWAYFTNLDASNYLEIGIQTGGTFYPLIKIPPGEAEPIRLAINAPYARANIGACLLDYVIVEA